MKVGVGRFVAGAACPRCGVEDRIKLFIEADESQRRECVACGFVETTDSAGNAIAAADPVEAAAVTGRHGVDGGVLEADVRPVRFIVPPPAKD